MTPRALFHVILKIFGLVFLKDIIAALPPALAALFFFRDPGFAGPGLWTAGFNLLIIIIYAFMAFCLLFRTGWIIDKLKLDKGFSQEYFTFNVSSGTVLTVAIIVMGGVLLLNEIPDFFRLVSSYYRQKRSMFGQMNTDTSYIIYSAVKIMLALLLIGERRRIAGFILRSPGKKEGTKRDSES